MCLCVDVLCMLVCVDEFVCLFMCLDVLVCADVFVCPFVFLCACVFFLCLCVYFCVHMCVYKRELWKKGECKVSISANISQFEKRRS